MANGNAKSGESAKKERLIPNQVVQAAYAYLQSVIAQNQKISAVRIEQLEPIEKDNAFWKVVLSYDAIGELSFDKKREFKEFKIDAYSGEVIYMKIFKA